MWTIFKGVWVQFNSQSWFLVPCCCMLLATFLASLAIMHQGRLMSHGRNWQLHVLYSLALIFCPYSTKTQPRYAKCVRQVAKGKQQHGTYFQKTHLFAISFVIFSWIELDVFVLHSRICLEIVLWGNKIFVKHWSETSFQVPASNLTTDFTS